MLVENDSHEMVLLQGSHYTYQIPRMYSGGVVIRGVSQEGETDERVDLVTRADKLRRRDLVTRNRFRSVDLNKHVMKDLMGLRPSRKRGYRLEPEGSAIHAYGLNTYIQL